ncbi:hypothetical protein MCP1_210029 [Candidatus Terasakiella magnetica]|nr:hypothetical protein MCP1_210029 [Candidatus Terasakiella magnetica]
MSDLSDMLSTALYVGLWLGVGYSLSWLYHRFMK